MSPNMHTRREFLRLAGMSAAALAFPAGLFAAERRKPNVIIIVSDDQGYAELGCHGCPDIPTPNLNSIAKNGIRFTDGYVTCPVCSPSRAGFITGRYQARFGHDHNPPKELDRTNWGLPLDQKTVGDYMKAEGYKTAVIGKWHLGDNEKFHPNKRGFDEFFGFIGGAHNYLNPTIESFNMIQRNGKPVDEKLHLSYAFGREAVSFIERNRENPFLLYLSFNAVHAPLQGAPRDAETFQEIKDQRRRNYAKLTRSLDEAVGSVLAKLRELNLEEDTMIFFFSDNGGPTPNTTSKNDPFKGFKTHVHEGGVRIPFMVQWKGTLPAGKTYSKPIISLDVLPTALAAAGGKAPENIDGVNLLPYLKDGKSGSPHEALFWRFDKQLAVRKGDWKLSRHTEHGVRLHNLASDKEEKHDLSAEQPEKVKELQETWDKWNSGNVKPLWPSKVDAPWIDTGW